MASDEDSRTPYRPTFLHPDEKGSAGTSSSIDCPKADQEVKPSPGTYIEYEANLKDLRLLTPYMEELKRRLGETCYVLQFQSPFSINSVPNEFKQRDRPLLWKVKTPESTGWTTDQDPKTFYFPEQKQARKFLHALTGGNSTTLDETMATRDNLNKLLW